MQFKVNWADACAIETHLRACDEQFVPLLSARIDIEAYCAKMVAHAVLFEAWAQERLVGLVAGYVNGPERQDSFVTNVSVQSDWHGKGVANRLLDAFIDHARDAGFARVVLFVDARNYRARALYDRHGFVDGFIDGTTLEMTFDLRTKQ